MKIILGTSEVSKPFNSTQRSSLAYRVHMKIMMQFFINALNFFVCLSL